MTGSRSYKTRLKNLKLVVKKRFKIAFKMLNDNIFLLKKLSGLMKKNEKIILRPHPNESIHEWNKIFLNYKNILIVRDDDVTPWIYAKIVNSSWINYYYASCFNRKKFNNL